MKKINYGDHGKSLSKPNTNLYKKEGMSQVIKSLPNLYLRHSSRSIFHRYVSSAGGDITRPALTPGSDILMQHLKNATTPRVVLKIVNEHYSIMNSKHIMQALRSLFDLQKCGSSDVSTNEILRHPDFNKLCRKLKFQSGVIELNETIEALKVISYVGVPSNSTIVQVLLQLIRQDINSLNLHHVIFLDFLVGQFNSSPLVEAFRMALPIIFEIHLPVKIDKRNVTHLAEYLHYASKVDLSKNSIKILVDALLESTEELDGKTAKSIIWSLTDMDPTEYFAPLLDKAINDLLIHIDELNYTDLESTLSKMVHKYTKKHSYFYNETFVDTCVNYLIDHDLGFKYGVYALRKIGRITHVNRYLLDYVSKKALEDPTCVTNADASDIYSIVIAMSLTSYRPLHWDNLKDLIVRKKQLASENKREIIWIRFMASLCLLDIYKLDVITKALNSDYLNSLFKKGFNSDFENYFSIWQSIKINRPELVDILPSKYDPEQVIDSMKPIPEFPLEASLQKGLGSDQYVLTDLVSKIGHQIDHAILFRKGGYPVAVNKDVKFIEDIEVLEKNDLLLILGLRSVHYTLNTKELRGSVALSLKSLEVDGYSVLPVNLEIWESLSDFERIPYLMQEIKNKMDTDIAISENIGK
ncbi:hypothetical protein NQ318_008334 [Aromia moschata]|uniref:RAP domain-containing protein n=1 Tax=Aromia moschata TaxID=1265417 RepID=A0AAV8XWD9_9CUCU|nr:hypothetical protein NQ318_008334 [Aromia moschata]